MRIIQVPQQLIRNITQAEYDQISWDKDNEFLGLTGGE
jgi:hypothetical protein